MALISIILPTYNVEKYIARALESCINQTFKDIEIIVVDDCGDDKSIKIAKEYALKDERIKIIHNKENLKLLRARYEGVKVAASPYIMFLDPDDYLELNACEECVKYFNGNEDLYCFNCFVLKQHKIENNFFITNHFNKKDYFAFLLRKLPDYRHNIWGKIFKKELLIKAYLIFEKNIKNTKITMAEDAILYLYYITLINNVATISKCLYIYNCDNENSSTKTLDCVKQKAYIKDLSEAIILIQSIKTEKSEYYTLYKNFTINQLKLDKTLSLYRLSKHKIFLKFYLKIKRKILIFKINKLLRNLNNIL